MLFSRHKLITVQLSNIYIVLGGSLFIYLFFIYLIFFFFFGGGGGDIICLIICTTCSHTSSKVFDIFSNTCT